MVYLSNWQNIIHILKQFCMYIIWKILIKYKTILLYHYNKVKWKYETIKKLRIIKITHSLC